MKYAWILILITIFIAGCATNHEGQALRVVELSDIEDDGGDVQPTRTIDQQCITPSSTSFSISGDDQVLYICSGTHNVLYGLSIYGDGNTIVCLDNSYDPTTIQGSNAVDSVGLNVIGNNNILSGCVIEKYDSAVQIEGDGNTIQSNILSDSNNGIVVWGSDNIIHDNQADGMINGFAVFEGNNNALTSNIATGNYFGFFLQDSDTTTDGNSLTANSATGNYWAGFHILGQKGTILTNNYASGSGQGFFIVQSPETVLTDNNANNNGQGMGIINSPGSVVNNGQYCSNSKDISCTNTGLAMNNGWCNSFENNGCNIGSCDYDCNGNPPVCNGDSVCNGIETCSNCPGDCGSCPPPPPPPCPYYDKLRNVWVQCPADDAS